MSGPKNGPPKLVLVENKGEPPFVTYQDMARAVLAMQARTGLDPIEIWAEALRLAVETEREKCARLCEVHAEALAEDTEGSISPISVHRIGTWSTAAQRIRERGRS